MEMFAGGLVTGGMNAARRRTQSSPMVQEGHFPNKASPNQAFVLIQYHHCVALDSSPTSGWHQDLFCSIFQINNTQEGGLQLTLMSIRGSYRICRKVFPLQSSERRMKHGLLGFAEWPLNSESSWLLWESWEPQFFFICHMEMITLEVFKRLKEKTENTQHIVASSFD